MRSMCELPHTEAAGGVALCCDLSPRDVQAFCCNLREPLHTVIANVNYLWAAFELQARVAAAASYPKAFQVWWWSFMDIANAIAASSNSLQTMN